jgi:predicted amidohydrolase
MLKDLRMALAVVEAPVGRIRENLDRITHWTETAAKQGAKLICFPEMSITGYSTRGEMKQLAQPIPGPATNRVSALARRLGIAILAGLAESDSEGSLFASHVVASPDGGLQVYRKIHIAPPEAQTFSRGRSAALFEIKGLHFGIQLCYDAHFPELATQMALKGADMILLPHASPRGTPDEKLRSWMRHLSARAFDNGLFIAAVNQTGDNGLGLQFPGVSVVIGPDGEILHQDTTGREGLLLADLSQDRLNRVRRHPMRYFLPNRRPDIYGL